MYKSILVVLHELKIKPNVYKYYFYYNIIVKVDDD